MLLAALCTVSTAPPRRGAVGSSAVSDSAPAKVVGSAAAAVGVAALCATVHYYYSCVFLSLGTTQLVREGREGRTNQQPLAILWRGRSAPVVPLDEKVFIDLPAHWKRSLPVGPSSEVRHAVAVASSCAPQGRRAATSPSSITLPSTIPALVTACSRRCLHPGSKRQ